MNDTYRELAAVDTGETLTDDDDDNKCWECAHMKQMCVATEDDIKACNSCKEHSNFKPMAEADHGNIHRST